MRTKKRVRNEGFGVLSKVQRDRYNNLVITSSDGKRLKMTTKYPEIGEIEAKARQLIGCTVAVFTSQTTANWSTLEYFCDLESLRSTRSRLASEPCGDFWSNISGEDGYIGDGVYAPK
ncbi:hypothetical protein [Vibrio agarivorans]|uniref:Uncharacterized protein n=1 Tax=Vibrio agarivorans TaxID=153622 RepID=A0ABT7Y058_9VIBR|nr:hypothetical protein [Vibrio agarivorans]MDN2481174.1 hypothetical protein [Vibrio agarivorans]